MRRLLLSSLTALLCLLTAISWSSCSAFALGNSDGDSSSSSSKVGPVTWNLRDPHEPLLKIPDNFPPSLDVTLAFPFDRFGIPLLHSLRYNASTRRYLLMLVSEDGRRGDFFELSQVGTSGVYATKGKFQIQLKDQGSVKVLRDFNGNQYNFIAATDGELRCAQIRGTTGTFIRLGYNVDGLIEALEDNSERTIKIDYANDRVTSLTQTWKVATIRMVKRWTASKAMETSPSVNVAYSSAPTFGVAKSVPGNALTPTYTRSMNECDLLLARIFGGSGAVAAANSFEPAGLARQYPIYRGDLRGDDGQLRRGHLSYAMHLYGSEDGRRTTDVYVPAGFTSHSGAPSPTDGAVTFYYPRLGNLTNITLAVFHVDDFAIRTESERVRIGRIGGRGGSFELYKHSHIEFYRGNTGLPASSRRPSLRIDPTTVFASRGTTVASVR